MNIQTSTQLAKACIDLAKNYKTLYVLGCFGAPLTEASKKRYLKAQSFNRKPERAEKINAANSDTFGFDCVCMIKGLLWDWMGDKNAQYGGAHYKINGVPDYDTEQMLSLCYDVSEDFSNIQVGEYLWLQGHAGVYIGEDKAVECTYSGTDGVQITQIHNIKIDPEVKGRYWSKHGKLPFVTYEGEKPEKEYTNEDFIRDIQRVLGVNVDGIAGPKTLEATVTVSSSYNRRHAVVKPLQKWLNELGFDCGEVDGYTGPKFDRAVREFQSENDCWVDGIITAKNKTWKKLFSAQIKEEPKDGYDKFIFDLKEIFNITSEEEKGLSEIFDKVPTVSSTINRKHEVVVPLQNYLYFLGYEEVGVADGCTGPNFDKAVKHYQKDNDCVRDGELTAKSKTWRKLLKFEKEIEPPKKYDYATFVRDIQEAIGAKVDGVAGPETLSKTPTVSASTNRKHAVVVPIQHYLDALGYNEIGAADGCTGPNFDRAVRRYQKDHSCYSDGIITAHNKTWKKLLDL